MENFRFIVSTILILVIVVFVGYWGFSTMESGSSHIDNQKLKQLTQDNNDLKKEVSSLLSQVNSLESKINIQTEKENEVIVETVKPKEDTTLKYQSLITELEKLISGNIFMKKGSLGTRVGTVQNFLNIYNNTSSRVDNDYGPGMETKIKDFQKSQGLIADGEAGPNTFLKMTDWLKKQG